MYINELKNTLILLVSCYCPIMRTQFKNPEMSAVWAAIKVKYNSCLKVKPVNVMPL